MTRARPRKPCRPSLAVAALAATVSLLCGTAATADLLVTRDGSVLETRGAWRVQGKLVVFELPTGQLSSLQLAEVDLEASRAASEEARAAAAKAAAPAPAPPERTAVLVLTDDDVQPAAPVGDVVEESAGESAGEETEEPAARRLVVSSWDEASGPDGMVFTGELVNESADVAGNIQLGVLLYDREGELQKSVLATVTSPVLQPGQRARFRAEAPGVFEYSALRFEAQSLGFAVGDERESSGDEG